MTITKQVVAGQIAAYLHHEMTLAQLVDWAERALMDGEFAEPDAVALSQVVARLGVADVRAFGLAWDDCEELLRKLGFAPRVEVVAV
jgi:cobyrinic acid a,c-diamide synthase